MPLASCWKVVRINKSELGTARGIHY
uniref:Uncharacterized protein n=1 Tax=Anguilla anguilla TaxID=7936 RepID=A0A0E9PZ43_ANGAN